MHELKRSEQSISCHFEVESPISENDLENFFCSIEG